MKIRRAEKFFIDLWWLGQLYRVASFVGLAAVLILVSFLYQRFMTGKDKEMVIRGYKRYEEFKALIGHMSGGEIQERPVPANEETIMAFIAR